MSARIFPRLVPVLAALALIAIMAGCASKGYFLRLNYEPLGNWPGSCGRTVAIVKFTDSRADQAIADKDNREDYFAEERTPAEWVTRATADELSEAGCRVQYHEAYYPYNVDYIITGELAEAHVHQYEVVKFTGKMRVKIKLEHGGKVVYEKIHTVSVEKTAVPTGSMTEQVLNSLLQDVMHQSIPDLLQAMR